MSLRRIFAYFLLCSFLHAENLYSQQASALLGLELASHKIEAAVYTHNHQQLVETFIKKVNLVSFYDPSTKVAVINNFIAYSFSSPRNILERDNNLLNDDSLTDGGRFLEAIRQSVIDKSFRDYVNLSKPITYYAEWKQDRPAAKPGKESKSSQKLIANYDKKIRDLYQRGKKDLAQLLYSMGTKIIEFAPSEYKEAVLVDTSSPSQNGKKPTPKKTVKPKPPLDLRHSIDNFGEYLEATLAVGIKTGALNTTQVVEAKKLRSLISAFDWIVRNLKLDAQTYALIQYKVLRALFQNTGIQVSYKYELPRKKGRKAVYDIKTLYLQKSFEYLKMRPELKDWAQRRSVFTDNSNDTNPEFLKACKAFNKIDISDITQIDIQGCLEEVKSLWGGSSRINTFYDLSNENQHQAFLEALSMVYMNCGISESHVISRQLLTRHDLRFEDIDLATLNKTQHSISTTPKQKTQGIFDFRKIAEAIDVINHVTLRIAYKEVREVADSLFVPGDFEKRRLNTTQVFFEYLQKLLQVHEDSKVSLYENTLTPLSCLYEQMKFGIQHSSEYTKLARDNVVDFDKKLTAYKNAIQALATNSLLRSHFMQYFYFKEFIQGKDSVELTAFFEEFKKAILTSDLEYFKEKFMTSEMSFDWKVSIDSNGTINVNPALELKSRATALPVNLSFEVIAPWNEGLLVKNIMETEQLSSFAKGRGIDSLLRTKLLIEDEIWH